MNIKILFKSSPSNTDLMINELLPYLIREHSPKYHSESSKEGIVSPSHSVRYDGSWLRKVINHDFSTWVSAILDTVWKSGSRLNHPGPKNPINR